MREDTPSADGSASANGRSDRLSAEHHGVRVHRLGWLERLTLAHVALLAISATWAFGGNADWVRLPLSWWASLGGFIFAAAWKDRTWRDAARTRLHWLWPLAGFNTLVLFGALNPSFREILHDGETMYASIGARGGWPSVALPGPALQALWLFDGVWISAFNLAFVVRQRRALRRLLLLLVGNALLLAVFGTVQKLSGATGIYFGSVPSPQKHFFATFVYHNHWGAFAVLMLAATLGLTWHFARRSKARDNLHSPALAGIVAVILLALTAPLSASRSASMLATGLLAGAGVHWLVLAIRRRRSFHESMVPPLAAAGFALGLAIAAGWFFAGDTIVARVEKTREQVADMHARGSIGARAVLYEDTWRMTQDRPWFGWGMASYPHVFTLYNSRESPDRLPVFYHDAHSDWLQAFAEHGFIGSALIGLCALVPLWSVGIRHIRSSLSRYLLIGCTLVLIYAWIEFPYGNMAVVLYWWICFFVAVQHAWLDRGTSE